MKRKHRKRSGQPGLAPGTISFAPERAFGTVHVEIVDYNQDTWSVSTPAGVEELVPPPPGMRRWVRICGTPGPDLLTALGHNFGVHNLILEDIASASQRIKVEEYERMLFAVLHTLAMGTSRPPAPSAREVGPVDVDPEEYELSLVLREDSLISVLEAPDTAFFAPIDSRLANANSLLRRNGVDFLFHALVDFVVDCYFPVLEALEEAAAGLEARILDNPQEKDLRIIHRFRGRTGLLRSTLWASRDLVSRVERSAARYFRRETLFYFRDIHDHVVHLIDAASLLRDSAAAMMELYMSGVSNRMNSVMKVLTIISTVFIPITFLVGVYGMNFAYMPELKLPWAYPALWGVMALVVGGMILFFRRKKWL